ncbi:hypothetical protein SCHPADRAFT_914084 [Schizopora paradoxa]|uniref:Integrase core domain-containing protein n=1 Tax=Schizopora paradoxa TaxID=27342 RepID=A0A0H2RW92_9AGAM|nr:hypothetical protein SCHPADRAFT_914084 [Schizopora paradoxa]
MVLWTDIVERSTRNVRIERLWVEVGSQFARRWRAFFTRLERLFGLKADDASHLWLLHYLFLNLINEDCKDFQAEWNDHPISGPEAKNQSPSDMRFIAESKQIQIDDEPHEGVHPETLEKYYGVEGDPLVRRAGQTGAGHPEDEPNNEVAEMIARISADQDHAIRHEAIDVPATTSPFESNEGLALFRTSLEQAVTQNVMPEGFEDVCGEWEESEGIGSGRRGERRLLIRLPAEIWKPRALAWARSYQIMLCVNETMNQI